MSEKKDPSIKLFGMMIQMGSKNDEDLATASKFEPSSAAAAVSVSVSVARDDIDCDDYSDCISSVQNILCSKQDQNRVNNNEKTDTEAADTKQEGGSSSNSGLEELKTPTSNSSNTENLETLTKDKTCASPDLDKKDQEQSDQTSSNSESQDQNTLKKPDKIIPCPRCSSMETKFCYFNNYNVNQPRHFCKNCQRYWTAGGSMRNVPVGAGRRKSKNSAAAQQRHLVIPGHSDGLIHHVMRPDGSVLAFGLDSSHPNQSKASIFKIGEGPQNFLPNGFFISDNDKSSSNPTSNASSISTEMGSNCNGGTESGQAVPCFPYIWNPITGFPVSFYSAPSPQWGENVARPCNLQWPQNPSMNSDQSPTTSSSPNSISLGKHSRDGTMLKASNSDKKESSEEKELQNTRVLKPKTKRFVEPSEAAKSSIWTTLGTKNNNVGSPSNGRIALFGDLQQAKGVNYDRTTNIIPGIEASSMVLQANPAAFSRSLAFHEIAQ